MTRRIALVLAWCVLVAAAVTHLPRLSFDNDTWLPADNRLRVTLENFRDEFEPDEALLIAIELPQDFFAPTQTAAIKKLDAALDALPQVNAVLSPLSATTIINRGDTLEIGSFADAVDNGHIADADAYRRAFAASPYAGKLLSPDHRTVALRAALPRGDSTARAAAVAAVTAVVHQHGFTDAHFAGEAALKDELNRATRGQLPRLLLIAALVLAIFLRIATGSLRRAGLVFTVAATAVAAALGLMAAFGWPMSAVLLALPVMVAVIAVADSLHILARWDGLADTADANPRLRATVRQTWLPCLGASVTSAVGFGAFVVSELTPLRHFGLASAAAIVYAYPLITIAVWGALWLMPSLRPSPPRRIRWGRLIAIAHRASDTAPWRVTAVAVTVTAMLGGGLAMLRTETNFLSVFFTEGSDVRRAFNTVDSDLGGSGRVEVVLHGGAESFATANALDTVGTVVRRTESIATVNSVESYLLPVGMVHAAFTAGDATAAALPQTDAALSQELLFLSLSRDETKSDVLSPYLDFNHGGARLSLQTPNLDSAALEKTITDITATVASTVGSGDTADGISVDTTITGFGVFIHNLGQLVLRTQAASIALTLALIAALLLFQFGMRAGAAGTIANLLPLAATAGLVAWCGLPYDFGTILIVGVTLGLSVDDTIHFLHHHRATGRHGALERTARPIVLTSALFCCGLAVIAVSDLVVLRRFALFTMFGMGAALVSALLILPALLAIIKAPSTSPMRKPQ